MQLQTDPLLLQSCIDHIQSVADPEKIFLLATGTTANDASCIFTPASNESLTDVHYMFLVLKKQDNPTPVKALQDHIEQHKGHSSAMTAMVYTANQFNDWINNVHPFAIWVVERAQLCYDAGNIPLRPLPSYDLATLYTTLFNEYQFYRHLAVEFMVAANMYLLRNEYNLALFNIHQAAEQWWLGLIRVFMGLRANTHNIDRLHRYAHYLNPELRALFPRNTNHEKQLFTVLHRAYIESRYKIDYKATGHEAHKLYERIERLGVIVEDAAGRRAIEAMIKIEL